jgi:hypothetical protein
LRFIIIPLLIIICIAIFVQVYSFTTINEDYETTLNLEGTNALEFLFGINIASTLFTITLSTGFLVVFIIVIIIGIFSGLQVQVLGSTLQLSERSQNLIFNILLFGGLWGLFSILASIGLNISGEQVGILSITIFGLNVGALGWFILTLIYCLGIVQQIQQTGTGS